MEESRAQRDMGVVGEHATDVLGTAKVLESAILRADLIGKLLRSSLALAACSVAGTASGLSGSKTEADVIVKHARVYTMNAQQAWAEAVAVRGDRILAIGTEKQVDAYRGTSTRVLDAGGRLVLPGITDCHVHFIDGSLAMTGSNWTMQRT